MRSLCLWIQGPSGAVRNGKGRDLRCFTVSVGPGIRPKKD